MKKPDHLHVSRKAIAKYGTMEGCPGCDAIVKRGRLLGRLGYNHSTECRNRVMDAMAGDPEYKHLAQRLPKPATTQHLEMITEDARHEQITHAKRAIMTIETQRRGDELDKKWNAVTMGMLLNQMDVAEIYSPPRVAAMAKRMGLRQGWSLDMTTCDRDGREWDFNSMEMRNRAVRTVLKGKPFVLIGSPMCGLFGIMNNINYSRMDAAEINQRIEYGRKRLKFCAQLYKIQVDNNRYFPHEHPEIASSWQEGGDQCMYGIKSHDGLRECPARKSIRFLTNAPCVARRLMKRCPNRIGRQSHNHVRLENGWAKTAQEYPDKLCREICRGIQDSY